MINFSLHHNVFCLSFVVVLYSTYSLYAVIKMILMKEVVMCNKSLRLKSPLSVNRPFIGVYWSTVIFTLHGLFFFLGGGGGVTFIVNLIFKRVGWQKFLILPWKSTGVVGRVAHAKSSDPDTPSKCTIVLFQTSAVSEIPLLLLKRHKCWKGFHDEVQIHNLKLSRFFW